MKVWIHIDGAQEGPYELSELPFARMNALTPVWHEGMATWQPAAEVPLVAQAMAAALGAPQGAEPQQPDQQAEQPQARQAAWQPQQQAFRQSYAQQRQQPRKAPASYLAWSIVMTLLCCNPVGIVPIITGASTRSKFNNRDYEGARRMSETTAWWVMITIVTSLMLLPFAIFMR